MKVLILLALFAGCLLYGASVAEITKTGEYLYGRGEAKDFDQADKNAIKDLVSQISVQVKSSFTDILTEENGNVDEFSQSVVETYSNTSLQAALREVDTASKPGKTIIYRYIAKTDLSKLFTARERKIKEYAQNGFAAEQDLRIGDALRNYYWSLALLRSHPDHNKISCSLETEGKDCLLISKLPDAINRILANLTIELKDIDRLDDEKVFLLKLNILYQDKPVQNLDISYYRGDGWSANIGCKDGLSAIELSGAESPKQIRLRVEYRFSSMRNIDNEVREALELNNPTFPNAEFNLKINTKQANDADDIDTKVSLTDTNPVIPAKAGIQKNPNSTSESVIPAKAGILNLKPYSDQVQQITNAIKKKNYPSIRASFTDKGWDSFQTIVAYGKGQLLNNDLNLTVTKSGGEITVREVPMLFRFANNNRQFVEKLVFIFTPDGKVDAVTFALGDKAVEDINKKTGWTQESKEQLIRFMEYYKTAYCLKDLSFLESVFADNALIIVGRALQPDNTPIDNMYKKLGTKFEYTRYDKQTYLKNLKSCFNSNEYVNLGFEDNIVKKVNGNEQVFGVQIAQNWYSTNYSDKGYLFLMLDLNDPQKPKIYVRSWQPEKNPDGSIIGLKDFQME